MNYLFTFIFSLSVIAFSQVQAQESQRMLVDEAQVLAEKNQQEAKEFAYMLERLTAAVEEKDMKSVKEIQDHLVIVMKGELAQTKNLIETTSSNRLDDNAKQDKVAIQNMMTQSKTQSDIISKFENKTAVLSPTKVLELMKAFHKTM